MANPSIRISLAESGAEIARCFHVMKQLRPDYTAEEFATAVTTQQKEGYRLVFLEDGGSILAVAGFRIVHMLATGRTLYVDDLVTDATERSSGHGSELFRWLAEYGLSASCLTLSLDSGTQRTRAHRFYHREGMCVTDFHFEYPL